MTPAALSERIQALSARQRRTLRRKLRRLSTEDDASLVAYITARDGGAPDTEQLRRSLADQLPRHMIPNRFVEVDSLPRLANGKVDRARLKDVIPLQRNPPKNAATETAPESAEPDSLTSRLAAVWARNLNVEFVLPEDDFFELGGHSLLGVQLLLDVKDEFGVEIPLADLLETPRLQDMVLHLKNPVAGARVVTTIQAGADETPVFSVHGGDKALGQAFGTNRPLYLVFDNISTTSADMTTVEKIAAHYLDGVRAVQPNGPYLLCGFSLGGMIAYEMAVRLTAAGETVQMVGLFDPTPPDVGKRGLALRAYRLLSQVANAQGLRTKAKVLLGPIARLLPWRKSSALPAAERVSHEAIRLANQARYVEIGFVYDYPVTDLDCVVYMPESHSLWVDYLRRKWQRVVRGSLAIESVPGVKEHADLTRPPYDVRTAQDFAGRVHTIEAAPQAGDR